MRLSTISFLLAAASTVAMPALAQQARVPASFPADVSELGCNHYDDGKCDNVPAPAPDFTQMVGTWVRVSILRNGYSVQPPDAPLMVKFMNDGWWSMMEFPAGRQKVNKPLAQMTPAELFNRFDRMGGGWGNYPTMGQYNYRHHKEGLTPGGENTQLRSWHFNNNLLVLSGTGPDTSPIVHTRKLPNQPLGTKELVGSWDRTSYSVNGAAVPNAVTEHLLLGEDGWFESTVLPKGRTSKRGVDMKDWTTADYVAAFGGMEASWGPYNAEAGSLLMRHAADVDPNLEDKVATGTYKLAGDTLTWTGTDVAGRKIVATYKRNAKFDIYAPLPPAQRGAGGG